ncbi:MAG: riboflavin biosynthesis protein RibF [Acidobacteriota bacterium]|nr:riboflavin biosynthesis protein RibF [Acidobacteriota bacterium]MDQ7088086.1 riboflavin biosynthesis protein RibF [Acidobacteriota bacterium]
MKVIRKLDELHLAARGGIVATIGNFDGLHLGHQAIMARVTSRAADLSLASAVVTFHPHPLRVLRPERAPRLMLTGAQKQALVEQAGIDVLVVLPFHRRLADMPAEAFVEQVLVRGLAIRELYVGPDFRFGRDRAGDVDLLARLGKSHGFLARGVEPVLDEGRRISASGIRRLLADGHVAQAGRLLGRPFTLVGTIVHGEGRGTTLLVPTANLAPENQFLPARGVYITRTRWGGRSRLGVTNVGIRPTFGFRRIVVETFLVDFEGDLYGQRVELELLERLREERKFGSAAELRAQIQRDIEAFKAWREENGAS